LMVRVVCRPLDLARVDTTAAPELTPTHRKPSRLPRETARLRRQAGQSQWSAAVGDAREAGDRADPDRSWRSAGRYPRAQPSPSSDAERLPLINRHAAAVKPPYGPGVQVRPGKDRPATLGTSWNCVRMPSPHRNLVVDAQPEAFVRVGGERQDASEATDAEWAGKSAHSKRPTPSASRPMSRLSACR
jgi:hypothetical protein